MELIMATRDDIRRLSNSLKSVEVVYSDPGFGVGINGVDLNIAKKMIFWSTGETVKISSVLYDLLLFFSG